MIAKSFYPLSGLVCETVDTRVRYVGESNRDVLQKFVSEFMCIEAERSTTIYIHTAVDSVK